LALTDVATVRLARPVNAFLDQLRRRIHSVEPAPLDGQVSRDVDDHVVLAAISARAAVTVMGDQDLLVIGHYAGTDILWPREFLRRLSG
jgi:predicted nucleic acid-binding protein